MAATPPETVMPGQGFSASTPDLPFHERHKKQLIALSKRVLEKVQESGVTTGNQIAKEILAQEPEETQEGEFKNIQRRVYDALNVLHALNVISKERNEIRYRGLVSREDVCTLQQRLEAKRLKLRDRRRVLSEQFLQFVSLKKLLERNAGDRPGGKVDLPCVVALGEGQSTVEVGQDRVLVSSDRPLTLLNDTQILARLGMHKVAAEDLSEDLPSDLLRLMEMREEEREATNLDFVKLFFQIKSPRGA